MNTRKTTSLLALLAVSVVAGCGGSDQSTIQTGESIDPQVFKQNAETYLTSVTAMGSQLASCLTQSFAGGSLGGSGAQGGQQGGPSIESCVQTFISSIKQESDVAQGATLTYLKGVTSPCKEKVQAFEDDVKSITEILTKDSGGKDVQGASKLVEAVQGGQIQGKLRHARTTFSDLSKTCAGLAPKGK